MTAFAQRIQETPMAPYIGLMQSLNREQKQIVLTFITESMEGMDDVPIHGTDRDKEMLDAALAEFSGDFGGEADARDVAKGLRQGAEMVRDVETW